MKLTLKKTIASILCISMIPSMMTGCKKESTSYSHTDFAMGTVTNITLYGTSDDLEQTEQKIIDMEKKLEKQQLSWRLKSSQVSKINQKLEQNNGKTKVTGNLKNWLQQAIKISQDSYADGRNTVDPTIGALTKLWDFESSDPKVPDANKIKKAISGDLSENSQHVTVKDNGEILACDKNTKIDLGAYGKGIGTDEAIKMIKKDKEITEDQLKALEKDIQKGLTAGIYDLLGLSLSDNPLERIRYVAGLVTGFRHVGCIGDSLASGEAVYKKADGTTGGKDLFEYSWGQYLARMTGNTYYNWSKGGLRCDTFLSSSLATECFDGNHKCEAYIIGLGQNENNRKYKIGTVEDINLGDYTQNPDTYYGNYGKIIQKIQ